MNLPITLAAISGEGVLQQLWFALIIGICGALIIWWIGKYFITKLGAPAIAMTVWNGIFILLGGICLINFLLGLAGNSFIKW